MDISESTEKGVKVAALKGRLDTATAPAAEAKLLGLLEGGAKVVADLAEVHYVSSAGLRVLLKAAKQAKAIGGSFAVASPQAPVREVLEISGFDKILAIHPSRDAAVGALT
ncbi:STAS domain-containing protein [Falsiroseomonas tokyonensis]|uniref:STAS domain-containing protein n=1 Tax=Falsiroseomonas tokyonensis TaxID=430521 RepID=A0ABV7BSN5_9PROT|nr:STAS domain-containing protein [Falsiroseomonas tokyonensis]MBU8538043.1 STAS domain-containing protein [Falsiroseomonas tokyonensis]